MKKDLFSWVCVFLLFLKPIMAGAWECEVIVTGPNTIKLDQQVTLSASGTPAGGSYSWSRTPGLIPNGSTATVTGFQPTFSEYIKVVGYYTSPKGKKCSDTKWLWACLCTLEDITGPSQAKVGEEVSLTTQGDPAGGIYSWTISSGNGTLTPNGPSATFVGDRQGTVEIKASYVPPGGGEPCAKYHTVEVGDDCSVSLSGDMYQRPVCRPVKFYAQGQPDSGECTWSPSSDFTTNGCNATYIGKAAGYYRVTTTYTTPNGSTCEDSKGILSYELVDNMTSKYKCYTSGASLVIDDFNITTSPAGFQNHALLSPVLVSTSSKTKDMLITASLFCDQNPQSISTIITIVNPDARDSMSPEFSIPDSFKEPLKTLGIAEQLTLSTSNEYGSNYECCRNKVATSSSGSTNLELKLPPVSIPIAGIPMPKNIERYVRADISVIFSGGASSTFKGEFNGCEDTILWSGEGGISVKLALNGGANATVPNVLVVGGEAEGSTSITESLKTVSNSKLRIATDWGGLTGKVAGFVEIPYFNFKGEFNRSETYFKADGLLPYDIDLPKINN